MNLKIKLCSILLMLVLVNGLAFASNAVTQLTTLCTTMKGIVPVVALLMFFTAGLIYAGGQIMGAETRARANVWSTAMLVGGIIGLIIAASAPYLLTLFGQMALGTATNTGGGINTGVTC
ncbi:MAG: hypothetical protein ABIH99_05130 [Candidatus Micrarchaeota archaeon]